MSSLVLGTNLAALRAAREQDRIAQSLGNVARRLASGQRINSASDDAAGLAISSTLNSNSKVYTQAVRNANDAISATNIAEGGLSQLSTILQRLKELASQSANGVYNSSQRVALHAEAASLTDEFNRITQSTEFNGLKLLDGTQASTQIQLGYGDNGSLNVSIGEELKRLVGTGAFGSQTSISGGTAGENFAVGDLNADGINDMVRTNNTNPKEFHVLISNGSGGFSQTTITSLNDFGVNRSIALGDLDNDGDLDVVWGGRSNSASVSMLIYRNNGAGSFSMVTSFGSLGAAGLKVEDLDGDNNADIIFADATNGNATVLWGNGSLNVDWTKTTVLGSLGTTGGIFLGDMNEDGRKDILFRAGTSSGFALSTGLRTFSYQLKSGGTTINPSLADIDYDGHLDLIGSSSSDGQAMIARGNGNGTFGSYTGLGVITGVTTVGDINGDGKLDIVGMFSSGMRLAINDGKGNFTGSIGSASAVSPFNALADMTGDGVLDFVNAGQLFIGQSQRTTTLTQVNLTTQADARTALTTISAAELRVQNQLGVIGAASSRLETALRNLGSLNENVKGAESRIVDADIASESAEYVKLKIRQDITASVQSQANLVPQLVLSLLRT